MRRHVKLAAELLNQSKDTRRPLIVVLGASGFMGSAVVDRLAGLPVTVRAVARGLSPVPAEAVADVETHQVDLARPGALAHAVEGADAVVHLVAQVGGDRSWRAADERTERVNVGVMRDLVTAFEGRDAPAPAVVFASTAQAGTSGEHPGPRTPSRRSPPRRCCARAPHGVRSEASCCGCRPCTAAPRCPVRRDVECLRP